VESFAEGTLKISIFLNRNQRVRVTQCIVLWLKKRSRVCRHNFGNRPEKGPDHGKNKKCGTQCDQPNREQTIASFLLQHLLTSFLAFTLLLETHENSTP
jgi:hypothetical protein